MSVPLVRLMTVLGEPSLEDLSGGGGPAASWLIKLTNVDGKKENWKRLSEEGRLTSALLLFPL